MYKKIFFLFYIFINQFLFAQNYNHIKGIVKDKKTKEILAFANITLKNKNIGTMSNEKGEFSFNMGKWSLSDTFCISFMGYETLKIPVKRIELNNNQLNTYFLNSKYISLNSITVLDKKITVRDIINKAIEKIPENYYLDEYNSDAYFISSTADFRNKAKEFLKIKSEYAVKIYHPAYEKRHRGGLSSDEQMDLIGIKEDIDKNQEKDTLNYSEVDLRSCVFDNIARYKNNKMDFLHPRKNRHYKLKIENILTYHENLVYEISYKRKKPVKKIGWHYNVEGKIYIRQKDYAILAVHNYSKYQSNSYYGFRQTNIAYKSYDNKLFLSYIYFHSQSKKHDFNEKTLIGGNRDTMSNTYKFFVNKIETKNVKKINADNFYENFFKIKYDPEFWENYNYILDTIPEQRDSLLFNKNK